MAEQLFDEVIEVKSVDEVIWPVAGKGEADVFLNGRLLANGTDAFVFAGKLHWRDGPVLKVGDRIGVRYRRTDVVG